MPAWRQKGRRGAASRATPFRRTVQLDEGHTLAEFYPVLESDEGAPIPEVKVP